MSAFIGLDVHSECSFATVLPYNSTCYCVATINIVTNPLDEQKAKRKPTWEETIFHHRKLTYWCL
ncbi:MAG: hypothetical protein ACUVUE_08200, partial [Candidatus Bathycorpusculaceae bacterium]